MMTATSTSVTELEKGAHYELTRYGFEYGALAIERMWDHDGQVCVRAVCRASGKYVDIYASPKGHSLRVFPGNEKTG